MSLSGCIDRAAELINEMHCSTAGALAGAWLPPLPACTQTHKHTHIHTAFSLASDRATDQSCESKSRQSKSRHTNVPVSA